MYIYICIFYTFVRQKTKIMEKITFKNREEYESKKEEIIKKFSPDFVNDKIQCNAFLKPIIEALTRGDDPCNIIEVLLINQEELMKEIKKLSELIPNEIYVNHLINKTQ